MYSRPMLGTLQSMAKFCMSYVLRVIFSVVLNSLSSKRLNVRPIVDHLARYYSRLRIALVIMLGCLKLASSSVGQKVDGVETDEVRPSSLSYSSELDSDLERAH